MHLTPQADNPDLNAALRLISTRALVLACGTGAAVALAHEGSMICRASVGESAPPLGCKLDTTSGFSGECVRTGKVLLCDDTETDPRVDLASSRRLGIRSILAAPISAGRDIVGLLEVFSDQPFAFDDGHLAVVERLAQTTLLNPPAPGTTPPPKLLVEREPAYQVFLRNLIDILRPPRTVPLKLTSAPAQFWADVFVPSRLPWERFLQSMVVHVIMILALGSLLEFWLSQRHAVQRLAFNKSDVIYYLPSEYLQALRTQRAPLHAPKKLQPSLAKRPVITVPHERNSRTQTITTPPDVKLKQPGLRLLHLVALNSVAPTVPLSATTRSRLNTPAALVTVVAPPPEISQTLGRRTSTGLNPTAVVGPPPEITSISGLRVSTPPGAAVIGPPPEISSISGPRVLAAPGAAVIGPPPEITSISGLRVSTAPGAAVIGPPPPVQQLVRQIGGMNIGYVEVVAPAPQMSSHEQGTLSAMVQASLRSAVTSVVPPPPSVNGPGNSGGQRMSSLPAAAMRVGPPPAVVRSAGNATRGGGPIASATRPLNVPSRREWIDDSEESFAGTKEMSVNFIGLALALPSSSYFSSHEVFIAEGRFSRYQTRLIKLVYEFLPYQTRLSEYGPNYPALDKLRVTRDPTCDEKLVQVMSSVNAPGSPQPDRLQRDLRYSRGLGNTLECYRTTADDYRKARARHR